MITSKILTHTRDTLEELLYRQGGSLFFNTLVNDEFSVDIKDWKTSVNLPSEYKPFIISIFDSETQLDVISLILFINPDDMVTGQQQKFNNAYTRKGWVNTAWGNEQATLSISGTSAGFYLYTGSGGGGLTNAYRRRSPSFINIVDIVGIFKNNGWYFLDGAENPSYFKDGTSRVINVMDSIKIEYDESIYIGSFNTFTLNDIPTKPYCMDYNFDFIVSSFGVDLQGIEGHVKKQDNYLNINVRTALQGANIGFKSILGLDEEELNEYYPEERYNISDYDYTDEEARGEESSSVARGEKPVSKIPEGRFWITRGWLDGEGHEKKCDFRTHTGRIYSATSGSVIYVQKSYSYGGSNYVLVKSVSPEGKSIYVRYFHLRPQSINLVKGDQVDIGTIVGREGTDGGKYHQHCDFEVREIRGGNYNYRDTLRIEATPYLNRMWNTLHGMAVNGNKVINDDLALDFTELYAKHDGLAQYSPHQVFPK